MNQAEACLKLVDELPGSLVESLILHLRNDSAHTISNPGYRAKVDEFLRLWSDSRSTLAYMLEVALMARRSAPAMELVWTGPSTTLVPQRRTEQVIYELIQGAGRRLTMTSFGVFQVERLVVALEEALTRGVQLRIVLGERESPGGLDLDRQRQQLGPKLAAQATIIHWPPERRPRDERGRAGLMHAKAAIADSCVAFLTSANLTEAALERNMELGILIKGGPLPASIDRLVDGLLEVGQLQVVSPRSR